MAIPEIKLSPADKAKLEGMQGDIDALTRELAKARTAGLDIADLEADFKKAIKLREGILRVYG